MSAAEAGEEEKERVLARATKVSVVEARERVRQQHEESEGGIDLLSIAASRGKRVRTNMGVRGSEMREFC